MSHTVRTLPESEREAFLRAQRTGVLSLGRDDRGYGIPVAFAYDPETRAVYLRLGYGPDSTKREFIAAAEEVTLVVYGETEQGWQSVLVRGPIEELADLDQVRQRHPRGGSGESLAQVVRNLQIPYVQVFDTDADADVEFVIGRIETEEITGVVEAPQE